MEKIEDKPGILEDDDNLVTNGQQRTSSVAKDVASRMYSGAPFVQVVGAAVSPPNFSVPDHIRRQYKQ